MAEQFSQRRMDGGLAAAEVDGSHAMRGQPVEALHQDRDRRMSPVRRRQAKAAARVAITRDPEAHGRRQAQFHGAVV